MALSKGTRLGPYEIREPLGAGGMGEVWKAYDTRLDRIVAIKTSKEQFSERLKHEARAASALNHPNIVILYDVLTDDGNDYLVMEYVEGETLQAMIARGPLSLEMLIETGAQVADALDAAHRAELVHRDIKPANILVMPSGVVKLTDFGIAQKFTTEDGATVTALTATDARVGTVAYMSPEQANDLSLDGRSDIFSLGSVLYEAACGKCPFHAREPVETLLAIITQKVRPIRTLRADLPTDFEAILERALAKRKDARFPTAGEMGQSLRRLRAGGASHLPTRGELFVGREFQLTKLHELFRRTLTGHAVIAECRGPSGIGKTTFLQRFVKELRQAHPEAVILTGRCHESEMVPFKALNEIVGSLSRLLKDFSDSDVEGVLSRDIHLVARLFPSLIQVPAIALREHRGIDIADSQEFRKRAFNSLLELLGRLCSRSPLVIAIDDLQWGDLDSAAFFREFVSSLSPANLLLIASYRSEDRETSQFLKEARKHLSAANPQVIVEQIEIPPLSDSESTKLARCLLAETINAPERQAMTIAKESSGSPFIIDQFASYVFNQHTNSIVDEAVQDHTFDLREVIEARIANLPDAARTLLTIVSIAGQPISDRLARVAARLSSEYLLVLEQLCTEHLLRVRETSAGSQVEIYHEQIREILNASLTVEDRTELHREMAAALQEIEPEDPAVLAMHFHEARMDDEATRFTIEAADKAYASLAFERAARLYRDAIVLKPEDRALILQLRRKLGDVLVASGRGVEAAGAYLASAETEDSPSRRIECFRLAADQYLRSGHTLEGISILRRLATSVGIRITESQWRVVLLILLRRALIKLGGLRYHERRECEIAPEQLLRLDVYWSLAVGFSLIDPLLGIMFHSKHLLLALGIGEPYRIGLSLAFEAGFRSLRGYDAYARAEEVLRKCTTLGLQLNRPHLLGLTSAIGATCGILTGRCRDAKQFAIQAVEILESQCTGVAWELATARTYYFVALGLLGEWKELSEKFPWALKDAQERNDLYALTQLMLTAPAFLVSLAADRPEEAYQNVSDAIASWRKGTQRKCDLPHFMSIFELAEVLLYKTSGQQAWDLMSENWGWMRRFLSMFRVEWLVVLAYHIRGRTALAAACATSGEKQRALLAQARDSVAKIKRYKMGTPFAALIRASIEEMQGRRSSSFRLLGDAEAGFEFLGMRMYAAVARHRRGTLAGGKDGLGLQASARAFMDSQSIVKPQHVVDMYAPGKWCPPEEAGGA
jgi:eukaryotic-like serine/threonine-protein kinase